ncbi:alpha/beta fold hydrolase [Nocardioides sp.]|uniref:alpha/beta fold hydrolase n=1 Tax=Nocardioides sp. TaxID=35761 RepID=UPI003D118E80
MTKVFVHGNPETVSVWDALVSELESRGVDDILLLSPPGFGAPIPEGFNCTAADYRDWLMREIESIGEPVDLVGHDWGAGHTFAVAADRPDLLRSWVADCCGIIHPDYVWHPAAQVWQTPGEGERLVSTMISLSGEELAADYGVHPQLASSIAEHLDAAMGTAILAVYRSAVQPRMRELGDRLSNAQRRPALMIHNPDDPYTQPELAHEVATNVGADLVTLDGTGHWWMVERPSAAAETLASFWDTL